MTGRGVGGDCGGSLLDLAEDNEEAAKHLTKYEVEAQDPEIDTCK